MMHSFSVMAIIGVLWTVCGYAMAFDPSIGGIVGWDPNKVMLSGIDQTIMEGGIPEYGKESLRTSWSNSTNKRCNLK